MTVSYKYECSWSQQDGWYFSFGNKKMWQNVDKFIVAELDEKRNMYCNHEQFDDLEDALTYMRLGKRE